MDPFQRFPPGYYILGYPVLDAYGRPLQVNNRPVIQGYGQVYAYPVVVGTVVYHHQGTFTTQAIGTPYQVVHHRGIIQTTMLVPNLVGPPRVPYQPNPGFYNPYQQTAYAPIPESGWGLRHDQERYPGESSAEDHWSGPLNTPAEDRPEYYGYGQPDRARQPAAQQHRSGRPAGLPSRRARRDRRRRRHRQPRGPRLPSPVQAPPAPSAPLEPVSPWAQAPTPPPETEARPPESPEFQEARPEARAATPETHFPPAEPRRVLSPAEQALLDAYLAGYFDTSRAPPELP
ncbi:hypothetical protein K445DRAFT_19620 [Daldinia sp. EC12]|nr:hypothetical protein K445DRAFT_19620 [Daldinia sp. EC12]